MKEEIRDYLKEALSIEFVKGDSNGYTTILDKVVLKLDGEIISETFLDYNS